MGARLVADELLKRGFDAKLSERRTKKYDLLVGLSGSPPRPVHVKAVHVPPWYVRLSRVPASVSDEVTVYVLLGVEGDPNDARFFVIRNRDMETMVRQPPNWSKFGLFDVAAAGQYEDNWDLLKVEKSK